MFMFSKCSFSFFIGFGQIWSDNGWTNQTESTGPDRWWTVILLPHFVHTRHVRYCTEYGILWQLGTRILSCVLLISVLRLRIWYASNLHYICVLSLNKDNWSKTIIFKFFCTQGPKCAETVDYICGGTKIYIALSCYMYFYKQFLCMLMCNAGKG